MRLDQIQLEAVAKILNLQMKIWEVQNPPTAFFNGEFGMKLTN